MHEQRRGICPDDPEHCVETLGEELRHFFENNPINPIKTNAPDGDEMMRSSGLSLDILNLLPDLLELTLHVDDQVRELHVLALRADRVGLT